MSHNLREGSRISYIGDGGDGRVLGERGQVLAITGRSGHVKWGDGSITLMDLDDIAPLGVTTATFAAGMPQDDLADSLDVGPIQATGVRAVYATQGGQAVLASLAANGQLGGFQAIADDARVYAEALVRQDPGVCLAVAQLDPEEGDELISLATSQLLRSAFGGDGGD